MAEVNDEMKRRPTLSEVAEMIEPKANKETLITNFERKINRGEVDLALAKKADSNLVDELMNTL